MPIGLGTDEKAERYLGLAYGLTRSETVSGIPVFRDSQGDYFVGGYKTFYTVIENDAEAEKVLAALREWRRGKKAVHYVFSTPTDPFKAKRLDFMLEIPAGTTAGNRSAMYEYNVRKHIRRVAESPLRYGVERFSPEWHALYARSIQELGSAPRSLEWFQAIETGFGDSAITITARDGDKLAGGLYCLVSQNYITLLSIASEKEYWPMRVNNGLYDRAIVYALEHGIHFVDLGPTMAADQSHWNVKTGFGATAYHFADVSFVSPYRRLKDTLQNTISRVWKRASKLF